MRACGVWCVRVDALVGRVAGWVAGLGEWIGWLGWVGGLGGWGGWVWCVLGGSPVCRACNPLQPTGGKAFIDSHGVSERKDLCHEDFHKGLVPIRGGNVQGGLPMAVELVEVLGARLAYGKHWNRIQGLGWWNTYLRRLEWLARKNGWLELHDFGGLGSGAGMGSWGRAKELTEKCRNTSRTFPQRTNLLGRWTIHAIGTLK